MSSSDWAETAIIAIVAAGLSSFLVIKLLKQGEEANNKHPSDPRYPHHEATFLQSGRTVAHAPDEKSTIGWSMADSLEAAKKESSKIMAMTPAEVLASLQKGNCRFWMGHSQRPEVSAFERRALIAQQFPSTAVIGCADSRVPVEIVFDQGLGDMFVIRVAGNVLGQNVKGSLEYAVHHLNVKVALVMGHEGCGAVKAAGLPLEKIDQESDTLAQVLKHIKGGLDEKHLSGIVDNRARDREAVVKNVRNQIKCLIEDKEIIEKVDKGQLIIVGAFYEISSGIVDFFMEVSKDLGGTFKPSPGVDSRYNLKTKKLVYA